LFEDDGPIADELELIHLLSFLDYEKARHLYASVDLSSLESLLSLAFGKPVTPPQPKDDKEDTKEPTDAPTP
jgi:hypothetical protein